MTDLELQPLKFKGENERDLAIGGLRFWIGYRGEHEGTTTRVVGLVDGTWIELLRFDDFLDKAHYHVPANARDATGRAIEIEFDRKTMGVPRAWYVEQIRDSLPQLLTRGGYQELLAGIDFSEISRKIGQISDAMDACLPDDIVWDPAIGLRRVAA